MIELIFRASCQSTTGNEIISTNIESVEDDGDYSVNFNDSQINSLIANNQDIDRAQNCALTIMANRRSEGSLASQFTSAGSIYAIRSNSVANIVLDISN